MDHTVDGNPKEKKKEQMKEKRKRRYEKMSWSKQREWNSVDKEEKEEKKKKEEKGRATNRERIEKKSDRDRERERGEKQIREIFPAFRRSKLNGSRRKVDLRNAGYVWVPKSWSFVKLREVENFPTWIIFSLKSI